MLDIRQKKTYMIKLSKKVEYSLMTLQHLKAMPEGKTVSAREIAEKFNLPFDPVSKVMQTLKTNGILTSGQGSKGGYALCCDLSKFSYLSLVRMVENIKEDNFCSHKKCELLGTCNIQTPVQRLQTQTNTLFEKINLNELLSERL